MEVFLSPVFSRPCSCYFWVVCFQPDHCLETWLISYRYIQSNKLTTSETRTCSKRVFGLRENCWVSGFVLQFSTLNNRFVSGVAFWLRCNSQGLLNNLLGVSPRLLHEVMLSILLRHLDWFPQDILLQSKYLAQLKCPIAIPAVAKPLILHYT